MSTSVGLAMIDVCATMATFRRSGRVDICGLSNVDTDLCVKVRRRHDVRTATHIRPLRRILNEGNAIPHVVNSTTSI